MITTEFIAQLEEMLAEEMGLATLETRHLPFLSYLAPHGVIVLTLHPMDGRVEWNPFDGININGLASGMGYMAMEATEVAYNPHHDGDTRTFKFLHEGAVRHVKESFVAFQQDLTESPSYLVGHRETLDVSKRIEWAMKWFQRMVSELQQPDYRERKRLYWQLNQAMVAYQDQQESSNMEKDEISRFNRCILQPLLDVILK